MADNQETAAERDFRKRMERTRQLMEPSESPASGPIDRFFDWLHKLFGN